MKALDVGIDLDGCAYPFTQAVRDFAISEGYDPEQVSGGGHDAEESSWDFYKDYWDMGTPEFIALCRKGIDAGVIFLEGAPFPGAVEAVVSMHKKGHRIHIITNRSLGARRHHNTSDWLNKWEIPYDSLIFSGTKSLFSSLDIMVDDYEHNFDQMWEVGVETWLFDRPWNYHVSDRGYRVKTWGEFEARVDEKAVAQ